MPVDRRTLARTALDLLILTLAAAGIGTGIGILTANGQDMISIADPTPYQNFGAFSGALLGALACLVAAAAYLALTRAVLHRPAFHRRLFRLLAGLAGAVTGSSAYAIVSASAARYGMAAATGWVVAFDLALSAVLGGLVALAIAIALTMVRDYD